LARAGLGRAVLKCRGGLAEGRAARGLDEAVGGRQRARGVGGRRVAREVEGLTAAAAEVGAAPVTAPARLGHPRFAAEGLERARAAPDVGERARLDVVEGQARNRVGGVARQYEP